MKKLNKKVKIAIISFIALGVTGIAILQTKKWIDKRRAKKKKKPLIKNKTLDQLMKVPKTD